jgi:hypothetical protein
MSLESAMRLFPLLALASSLLAAEWTKGLLNNEGLVLLARAGYGERFLADLVHSQPSSFDTSVEGLVFLAKNGISERMVRHVLAAKKRADEADSSDTPLTPLPATPVRLKARKQTVLVPESLAGPGSSGPVLLFDPRYLQPSK